MGVDRVRRDIELARHLAVGHALCDEPDDRQLRLREALPTGLRTLSRDQPPTDSELAQPSADPGFVPGCASFCVELEGAPEARDGPVAIAACEPRHAAVLE